MNATKTSTNVYGLPGTIHVHKNESRLGVAERLIIEEVKKHEDSTSPGTLLHLRRIAEELDEIECSH